MDRCYTLPEQIEELRKLPYEMLLVDTSYVLHCPGGFIELCRTSVIKETKRIPVLCDFTEREIHNAGGREYKRVVDKIRNHENEEHFVAVFETPFKTIRECKESLDMLPKRTRHAIIKVYRDGGELQAESRYRDFALLTVFALLSYTGICCNILSLDNCVRRACHVLINMPKHANSFIFERDKDHWEMCQFIASAKKSRWR